MGLAQSEEAVDESAGEAAKGGAFGFVFAELALVVVDGMGVVAAGGLEGGGPADAGVEERLMPAAGIAVATMSPGGVAFGSDAGVAGKGAGGGALQEAGGDELGRADDADAGLFEEPEGAQRLECLVELSVEGLLLEEQGLEPG